MPRSLHTPEFDLALFISGDISLWKYVQIQIHAAACETCRSRIEAYRTNRQRLKETAAQMPEGADWDRLAAEMTANIRVGLAAGECVAPRRSRSASWRASAWANRSSGWKPVAAWSGIAAGVVVLLSSAFILNLPPSDADSLVRVMRSLVHGTGRTAPHAFPGETGEDQGAVVQASAKGVELRENGVAISTPQANTPPVAITVSAPGSASARYVDEDTGQVIVQSVYVQ